MFAISTPVDEQYAGDGIAAWGVGYGIKTIRVDGNDLFAVYNAVSAAWEIIIKEKRPALVEAISYWVGDHSTSDYAQLYRNESEMKKINSLISSLSKPIDRLEKFLLAKGWIEKDFAEKKRKELFSEITKELKRASGEKLPPIGDLYNDVYHSLPYHLKEQ